MAAEETRVFPQQFFEREFKDYGSAERAYKLLQDYQKREKELIISVSFKKSLVWFSRRGCMRTCGRGELFGWMAWHGQTKVVWLKHFSWSFLHLERIDVTFICVYLCNNLKNFGGDSFWQVVSIASYIPNKNACLAAFYVIMICQSSCS